ASAIQLRGPQPGLWTWSKSVPRMTGTPALPMLHRPLLPIRLKSICTQPPNSPFSRHALLPLAAGNRLPHNIRNRTRSLDARSLTSPVLCKNPGSDDFIGSVVGQANTGAYFPESLHDRLPETGYGLRGGPMATNLGHHALVLMVRQWVEVE